MPASKLMKKVNRVTRNYTQRVVHGAVKKTKDVVVDDDYVVLDANAIRVSPAPQTKKTLKRSIQSSPCDTSSSLHKNKVRVSPSILPGADTFPSRLPTSIERGEECQQINPSEDSDLRISNVRCDSENKSSTVQGKPTVTNQRRSMPALRSPSLTPTPVKTERPIIPLPVRAKREENIAPLPVLQRSPSSSSVSSTSSALSSSSSSSSSSLSSSSSSVSSSPSIPSTPSSVPSPSPIDVDVMRPIRALPRRKIQLRQNTLPLFVASPSPFRECFIRPKENRITIQQAYALPPSVFTKLFPCKTELTDDEEELWEEVFGPVMDWY
ncbi:hypothetical protein BDQ17DRAFT_1360058 [Cyathus striatus]|nr:hypothetical protein BDQ17DRAFT_1360058 [Cyathus striatus]